MTNGNHDMRPLHNASIRHSGLDPESRKYLIILDSGACPGLRSGIRRNDKIAGFIQLCKGLDIGAWNEWGRLWSVSSA